MTRRGIKTADGTEHELDTILYATGFDLEASLRAFTQTGTGKEDNMQEWKKSPYAYKGITHPNHPNFFILLGEIPRYLALQHAECRDFLQDRVRGWATTVSSS